MLGRRYGCVCKKVCLRRLRYITPAPLGHAGKDSRWFRYHRGREGECMGEELGESVDCADGVGGGEQMLSAMSPCCGWASGILGRILGHREAEKSDVEPLCSLPSYLDPAHRLDPSHQPNIYPSPHTLHRHPLCHHSLLYDRICAPRIHNQTSNPLHCPFCEYFP